MQGWGLTMMVQPPRFAIQLTEIGENAVRIGIEGEIDLVTAPGFARVLRAQIADHKDVRLDFSGTTFMDSTGLKVLIDGIERCRRHGTRLRVEPGVPHQISRLFEITGVDAVLRSENAELILHPH
jgi:anti-sigma B factor antagonist